MDDGFEKGDHCRVSWLHLHYIWPRSQPPGHSPGKLLIKSLPEPAHRAWARGSLVRITAYGYRAVDDKV
jgi:hypothetical protein